MTVDDSHNVFISFLKKIILKKKEKEWGGRERPTIRTGGQKKNPCFSLAYSCSFVGRLTSPGIWSIHWPDTFIPPYLIPFFFFFVLPFWSSQLLGREERDRKIEIEVERRYVCSASAWAIRFWNQKWSKGLSILERQ